MGDDARKESQIFFLLCGQLAAQARNWQDSENVVKNEQLAVLPSYDLRVLELQEMLKKIHKWAYEEDLYP